MWALTAGICNLTLAGSKANEHHFRSSILEWAGATLFLNEKTLVFPKLFFSSLLKSEGILWLRRSPHNFCLQHLEGSGFMICLSISPLLVFPSLPYLCLLSTVAEDGSGSEEKILKPSFLPTGLTLTNINGKLWGFSSSRGQLLPPVGLYFLPIPIPPSRNQHLGTYLVVQCLRICFPMRGTRVQALVGGTKIPWAVEQQRACMPQPRPDTAENK